MECRGGRDRNRMGRDLAGCYELTVAPGGQLNNCLWNMTQENGRRQCFCVLFLPLTGHVTPFCFAPPILYSMISSKVNDPDVLYMHAVLSTLEDFY